MGWTPYASILLTATSSRAQRYTPLLNRYRPLGPHQDSVSLRGISPSSPAGHHPNSAAAGRFLAPRKVWCSWGLHVNRIVSSAREPRTTAKGVDGLALSRLIRLLGFWQRGKRFRSEVRFTNMACRFTGESKT